MYSIEKLNYYLQFLQHLVQEVHIFASTKPFLSVHSNGIIKTRSHYQNRAEVSYYHYQHQGGRQLLPHLNISKFSEIKNESNFNFLSMRNDHFSKFSLKAVTEPFGHPDNWDEYMTVRFNLTRSHYVLQLALALWRQSYGHLIHPKAMYLAFNKHVLSSSFKSALCYILQTQQWTKRKDPYGTDSLIVGEDTHNHIRQCIIPTIINA